VSDLAQTIYQGFDGRHPTETLAVREEIHLSRATVDRLLQGLGWRRCASGDRPGPTAGGTGWLRRVAWCR
jgi:hypothetical protein